MEKELDITYKGLHITVTGDFTKGKGSINLLDPPEEDEFTITNISTPVKPDEDFDFRDRLDIAQLCLEKLR